MPTIFENIVIQKLLCTCYQRRSHKTLATSLARKVNSFSLMDTICYTKHSNKTVCLCGEKTYQHTLYQTLQLLLIHCLTALGPTIPAQFTMISSRSENSVNSANPCLTEASSDTSTLQPLAVCPASCSSATNVFRFLFHHVKNHHLGSMLHQHIDNGFAKSIRASCHNCCLPGKLAF